MQVSGAGWVVSGRPEEEATGSIQCPEATAGNGCEDEADSTAGTTMGERLGADAGPESEPPAPDAGVVTAEYAIATLAAAAFAGVLLVILRSGEVRAFLLGIIRQALSV